MFLQEEFLAFMEEEFYRKTEQAYDNFIFEWLDKFDTDVADFEMNCDDCLLPEDYWRQSDNESDWHELQNRISEFSWRVQCYYGISLFRKGLPLEAVQDTAPLSQEQLLRIPGYAALTEQGDVIFAQILRENMSPQEDIEKWRRYYRRHLKLISKSYLWAGYFIAMREAKAIGEYDKSFEP